MLMLTIVMVKINFEVHLSYELLVIMLPLLLQVIKRFATEALPLLIFLIEVMRLIMAILTREQSRNGRQYKVVVGTSLTSLVVGTSLTSLILGFLGMHLYNILLYWNA